MFCYEKSPALLSRFCSFHTPESSLNQPGNKSKFFTVLPTLKGTYHKSHDTHDAILRVMGLVVL